MIGSNINKKMLCVLVLLANIAIVYAQNPVITPKKQPIVFQLDNTGAFYVTLNDVATVTPDATDPNPIITISPSVFTCIDRGLQKVAVSVSDAPPQVTFNNPTGIVTDATGNFYITDAGNHKIRKIAVNGDVTDFAGSGNVGINDGLGTVASFDTPEGIAIDAAGNLYVTDVKAGLIRKIGPAGLVTTLAGTAYSTANDQGTGLGVSFDEPYGIAVDSQGNLYVCDAIANKIKKVSPTGFTTTFAGSTKSYADGTGTAAEFSLPTGITIDAAGNLYVADTFNERIRKITPAGVVTTLAGNGATGLYDAAAGSALFNMPYNLIVAANGDIYVADTQNEAIRKISNGQVTTLAGNGIKGDQIGPGVTISPQPPGAEFNTPEGLAFDAAGSLYVCDVNNNRIKKITPNSIVAYFAGTETPGSTNGTIVAKNYPLATDTIAVTVETTLKITTKYDDVHLATCVTTMPDFATARPPQTTDNCNDNIVAHQSPAPGTPLTSYSTTPVYIIIEDATGKYDSTQFNVYTKNLVLPPTVSITPSILNAVCPATPVSFSATTTNADSVTYQWQVNGNNQGSNDSTFTSVFNNGDIVTCNIISKSCSTPASSKPDTVSVAEKPTISFAAGSTTIKNGSSIQLNPIISGNIASYKWSPATGLSNDTIPNPIATPEKTTTYQLNVANTSGCDTTGSITINVVSYVVIPNLPQMVMALMICGILQGWCYTLIVQYPYITAMDRWFITP